MRTPKFAIPETLKEHTIMEDMEKAFAKIRMELRDEEIVGEESDPTAPVLTSKEDEESRETEIEESVKCDFGKLLLCFSMFRIIWVTRQVLEKNKKLQYL